MALATSKLRQVVAAYNAVIAQIDAVTDLTPGQRLMLEDMVWGYMNSQGGKLPNLPGLTALVRQRKV